MERPDAGAPRLLRALAGLLIRGPDAPYVLGDLDEGWKRDLARGRTVRRARVRFLRNALTSAVVLTVRRATRPTRWASLLDLKLGLRMLRKQPALTAVAVFALAVGIPVGMIPLHLASMFATDLPFDEGERIIRIQTVDLERSRVMPFQLRDYSVWKEQLTSVAEIGALGSETRNIGAEDGDAAPVPGAAMTASLFDLLRTGPELGRRLVEGDEAPGAPDVVVLGFDLWQSRFGGAPDIVGQSIRLGDRPHEVVGVMPEGFLFPTREHFWVPFRADPLQHGWGEGPPLTVYARLADGVSIAQANVELDAISRRIAAAEPATHELLRAEATPGSGADIYDTPEFWTLQFLALLLLTVTCGNVGTLILARTATRRGEIAIRTALGASRARIVGQLFFEALFLALAGAGFGLLLGDTIANRLQNTFEPQGLPFWFDLGVTWSTTATALGLAAFSAGIAGVIPALKATGRGVQDNLKRVSAGASGIRFGGLSTALIISEVALATAFLAMGAQLLPSVLQDPADGMQIVPDEYLAATLVLPFSAYASGAVEPDTAAYEQRLRATQEEVMRRLDAEPGVRSVTMASRLPGEDHRNTAVEIEGGQDGLHVVHVASVDVDFFTALGQAPLEGRLFERADVAQPEGASRTAVIVNQTFVEDVLGGRSPLGQRLRRHVSGQEEPGPWLEVVGVVGHLGMNEINPDRDAGLYLPMAPGELNPVRLAIRHGSDPAAFAPELRRITSEVDSDVLINDPMSLPELVRATETRVGSFWGGILIALIAGVASVLSAAGLYALVSFTVSERRREIGIRSALGAQPGDIVSTVARRALLQLAVGVVAGLVLRVMLMDLLDIGIVLHEVEMPVLLTAVAVTTFTIGMLACLPPLLRGLRVRPVEVLKEV